MLQAQSRSEQISTAKDQILKIKENGLVIRFDTRSPIIDTLKAKGLNELLDEEVAKLKFQNTKITEAFKSYNFGPVYFSNSEEIEKSREDGTLFAKDLKGNLVKIDINKVCFLNPYRVFLKSLGDFYLGYAVQNYEFENLDKPFPYYVLKKENLFKKSYLDLVYQLQNNFTDFYNKVR